MSSPLRFPYQGIFNGRHYDFQQSTQCVQGGQKDHQAVLRRCLFKVLATSIEEVISLTPPPLRISGMNEVKKLPWFNTVDWEHIR